MSVLESNLCEESVAEYSVTTVSGDVLRSSAGYVHLVQEVWGPLQQEVWGLLDSSNERSGDLQRVEASEGLGQHGPCVAECYYS